MCWTGPVPSPTLRPLRVEDASAVLAAFSSATDMARQGDVSSMDAAVTYLQRLTGGDHVVFGLTVDGRVVGAVGVTVDRTNRCGWVWYWMHAAFRGRGWTARATATVANWALGRGGLERLELGYRVNNPASARVAAAAGFVVEGRERGKFLIDGERVDVESCGRLRSDPWPDLDELELIAAPSGSAV